MPVLFNAKHMTHLSGIRYYDGEHIVKDRKEPTSVSYNFGGSDVKTLPQPKLSCNEKVHTLVKFVLSIEFR